MESIENVEKEISKVISKFTGISNHSDRIISDQISLFDQLRQSIDESEYSNVCSKCVAFKENLQKKEKSKVVKLKIFTIKERTVH